MSWSCPANRPETSVDSHRLPLGGSRTIRYTRDMHETTTRRDFFGAILGGIFAVSRDDHDRLPDQECSRDFLDDTRSRFGSGVHPDLQSLRLIRCGESIALAGQVGPCPAWTGAFTEMEHMNTASELLVLNEVVGPRTPEAWGASRNRPLNNNVDAMLARDDLV